jgi:hypothetical protein
MLLAYSVDVLLVGLSFSAIKKAFRINISIVFSIIILMILFAIIDNMIIPLVNILDLTFTIHNKEIADFLEVSENIPASALYSIDYFDIILWLVESLIALFVIDRKVTKKLNAI